jgi:uncharacterized membrane protein
MLKSIYPIWGRLRHLRRPQLFTTHNHAAPDGAENITAGQRLAERVAAFVGSWWFLGGQAGFLVLWLIYNTLQFTLHFDPPPYILLNLLLSFQAAFTGPVLLIAANVGAVRDHQQADRIENLGTQNERLTEANERLTERLVDMEQMLEQHIVQSLKAHTEELQNQGALLRAVHAAVCGELASEPGAPAAGASQNHPLPSQPNDQDQGRSRGRGGSSGRPRRS